MQAEKTVAQILAADGIADYAHDRRQLPAAELRWLFAFANSGKINATRVIKNLIWQAYTAIRAGQRALLRWPCQQLRRPARHAKVLNSGRYDRGPRYRRGVDRSIRRCSSPSPQHLILSRVAG